MKTIDPKFYSNKPEVNLDYKIAIMNFAKEGYEIECIYKGPSSYWGHCSIFSNDQIIWNWEQYIYRVAPPKIAGGYNPINLTEDEVGIKDGWRLLTKEEHNQNTDRLVENTQFFIVYDRSWSSTNSYFTNKQSLRTQKPVDYYLNNKKITEGHNPEQLTELQVGVKDGWRLLSEAEIKSRENINQSFKEIEAWNGETWKNFHGFGYAGACMSITYRTKMPKDYFLIKVQPRYITIEELPFPCYIKNLNPKIDNRIYSISWRNTHAIKFDDWLADLPQLKTQYMYSSNGKDWTRFDKDLNAEFLKVWTKSGNPISNDS